MTAKMCLRVGEKNKNITNSKKKKKKKKDPDLPATLFFLNMLQWTHLIGVIFPPKLPVNYAASSIVYQANLYFCEWNAFQVKQNV